MWKDKITKETSSKARLIIAIVGVLNIYTYIHSHTFVL